MTCDGLVKPWHFVRHLYIQGHRSGRTCGINHWSCEENNNVVKTADGGSQFVLPGEKGYKDPNKILETPAAGGK